MVQTTLNGILEDGLHVMPAPGSGDVYMTEESNVLLQLQSFPLTDQLRVAAREGRRSVFEGQVAMVANMLQVFVCYIMYLSI